MVDRKIMNFVALISLGLNENPDFGKELQELFPQHNISEALECIKEDVVYDNDGGFVSILDDDKTIYVIEDYDFQGALDVIWGDGSGEEFGDYCQQKGMSNEQFETLRALLYMIDNGNDL